MTVEFAALSNSFSVASQLRPADMDAVRAAGFSLVVNNRPDDEEDDQPGSAALARAAAQAGLDYVHIPIDAHGVAPAHAARLARALERTHAEKTLGFCMSGKRSALVWAHAEARAGRDVDAIIETAENAGFFLGFQREALTKAAETHTSILRLPEIQSVRRFNVPEFADRRISACCPG